MSALERILAWPAEATDRYRLALWTAAEIAEATGGAASGRSRSPASKWIRARCGRATCSSR